MRNQNDTVTCPYCGTKMEFRFSLVNGEMRDNAVMWYTCPDCKASSPVCYDTDQEECIRRAKERA